MSGKGAHVSADEIDEIGPIDYLLVEWPGRQPTGEAAPILVDLVERGIIRVLDLAFIAKAEDGSVAGLELADLGEKVEEFKVFEGASAGLLSDEDTAEAAEALEPGTSAALLVYENRWAAPFASAVRRSGGQLVANGRIPVQAILAALDAAEAAEETAAKS
jgi:dihydroorotase-like cyclic amidohydrolase